MGDLTASPFTPDSKKTFSLPELMKKGLHDPNAVKDVATPMLSYIQPKFEETIEVIYMRNISIDIIAFKICYNGCSVSNLV